MDPVFNLGRDLGHGFDTLQEDDLLPGLREGFNEVSKWEHGSSPSEWREISKKGDRLAALTPK